MPLKHRVLPPLSAEAIPETGSLVECCFTSTETAGLLGTGAQDIRLDFHTAPDLWLGLDDVELNALGCRVDVLGTNGDQCVCRSVQCCFTSTETIRLIRTGSPEQPQSTFTQLLNSQWLGPDDDDDVELHRMSVDLLGTNCDQCLSGGGDSSV